MKIGRLLGKKGWISVNVQIRNVFDVFCISITRYDTTKIFNRRK